jgi:hypothetical protein
VENLQTFFFEDIMDKDDAFLDKCVEGFVMFNLNQGDALLYFSAGMDGLMDDWAQLEICPVQEGSGWLLIKRFYTRSGRRDDSEH